jgi:hypothetical protein
MNTVCKLEPVSGDTTPAEGTRRIIGNEERVLYDGYWIKTYPVPADSLDAKKRLIEALTRRLFNHTEHGLNIPGTRLCEARTTYAAETDPARRRVKAAMLAGSMFNRATDIFRKLVELQADGIEIRSDDALMRECGQCLLDAMELGRFVRHRSGEEGIDELWGEPFRAFSIPVEDFYESRYIKIGQSMRDIDKIANAMLNNFAQIQLFEGIETAVHEFAEAAKLKTETLRTDPPMARTFSISGRNWSPPANAWPTSRQSHMSLRQVPALAVPCTVFQMVCNCCAMAATWFSTLPAPGPRCRKALANTSSAAKFTSKPATSRSYPLRSRLRLRPVGVQQALRESAD